MTSLKKRNAELLPPTLELYFTNRCNLGCRYCSSGLLKGGAPKTLSFEEIMRGIGLAAGYAARRGGPALTVGLTGGEPLLEFDLVRRVVKRVRREYPGLNLHLCTNGTLLDREKAGFLLENGVELDLSLDGAGAAHDRNRRFGRGGAGSVFGTVMANLGKLPRGWLGRMRAVATFNSGTISGVTDSLKFLYGLGFKSAGFGLDIYELWPRKKLPVLAAALARFRAYYLEVYKEALRGGARPAPFPFENKLGGAQSALVSNEFSLSVDGYFFPSDTVCRGKGGPGCTIGDLRDGIDFKKLERTYAGLSELLSRYNYPNGILPAADRYYHAIFAGADSGEALRNGLAVSEVFAQQLGGLMYAKELLDGLLTDKAFGDFSHRPKYSAGKPVGVFASEAPRDLAASRKALDFCFCSPGRGKRLELEAPAFSDREAKLALYALVKAEQLGRPLKISLQG